ncbi:hypothetical protein [Streptomyces sp. NPDC046832]|uniref:hypothetical protein n=1 Tax=Streptomyces sp. NPDC046832 TaxID=3155020 RepID=UPI0033F32BEE
MLGVVLLAAAGTASWRLHRTVVRRRDGHYTAAELARLDTQGLALAAARMLRRDGWRVLDLTAREGRPRLYARDRQGRELDVAFPPGSSASATDEDTSGPAPLREAGRPGVGHLIRSWSTSAPSAAQTCSGPPAKAGVHLLDARQLQRWASGATLDDLGLLGH